MHDTAQQYIFAEITYITEIILFLFLFVSYYFATEKQYDYHKKIIRYMVLIQTCLIVNMIFSFFFTHYGSNYIIHAIIGTLIYLEILYTFFLMEKKIPKRLRISVRYQPLLMRITALLWGIAILSGLISYLVIID